MSIDERNMLQCIYSVATNEELKESFMEIKNKSRDIEEIIVREMVERLEATNEHVQENNNIFYLY